MSGSDEIRQVVGKVLESRVRRPVLPEDELAALGLDSLAMAELMADLEERLGIQTDDRILDVKTVTELEQYLADLRHAGRRGSP